MIKLAALVYLALCLVLIVGFIVALVVTDIRWRLRQRKRNAPFVREWRLP